jgi:hypothetical protein
MSRRYKPYHSSNANTQDIIQNLQINSLDEIDTLSDNDIELLITKTILKNKQNDLENIIEHTQHLYNRTLQPYEIRNIKISFLLEHLINNIIQPTHRLTNIELENNNISKWHDLETIRTIPSHNQNNSRKKKLPRQWKGE